MALVVEDGSVVAGANTYVSEAYADSYFEARNSSEWAALSTEQKEAALLYATSWVDSRYSWPGTIVSDSQALSWPRLGAYDVDLRSIPSTSIPSALLSAVCEAALAHIAAVLNEVRERGGGLAYAKVDVLEVSYFRGAAAGRTFPYIDSIVSKIAGPFSNGILTTYR